MQILFISHQASHTGAPLVLLSLIKSIRKEIPAVSADLLLMEDGPLKEEFEAYIDHLHTTYPPKGRSLPVRIKRRIQKRRGVNYTLSFLKKKKYDCIYANTVCSLSLALEIKKRINKPLILHVHESEYQMALYGIKDTDLKQCDSIIAVSPLVRQILIEKYHYQERRISVIYPFSDFMSFDPEMDVYKSINSLNPFTVVLSGYADWVKGSDILPLVIRRCYDRSPNSNIQFVWVGEFEERERLKIEYDLERLGVHDCLSIVGSVDNPIELYKSCDAFLLLSREESFSLAAIENALLGKPIIYMEGASGYSSILKENAGIKVPYLDIERIAETILHLAADQEYARELGRQERESARAVFSEMASISSVMTILKESHIH